MSQKKMFLLFVFTFLLINGSSEMNSNIGTAKFHIRNNCEFKVWPAIVPEAGNKEASSSGFELGPAGDSKDVFVPALWSGRVWGRTGCAEDPADGMLLRCMTGDCGTSTVECATAAGNVSRETTVATLTLNGSSSNYINITTLAFLPMTVTDESSTSYEFDFCFRPPPPTEVKPVNDNNPTAQARNDHHDKSSTNNHKARRFGKILATLGKFLLGAIVTGVTIAVLKYFCGDREVNPTTQFYGGVDVKL